MKINMTTLKAAIERHNDRQRAAENEQVEKLLEERIAKLPKGLLARRSRAYQTIAECDVELDKLGLSCTSCANAEPSFDWDTRKQLERSVQQPCVQLEDVLLRIAQLEPGTSDGAAFDSLGLNWRDKEDKA